MSTDENKKSKSTKPCHRQRPSLGLKEDFQSLMSDFLQLKTVRFNEFSKIWCSKKMSYLCAGRFSLREVREVKSK